MTLLLLIVVININLFYFLFTIKLLFVSVNFFMSYKKYKINLLKLSSCSGLNQIVILFKRGIMRSVKLCLKSIPM